MRMFFLYFFNVDGMLNCDIAQSLDTSRDHCPVCDRHDLGGPREETGAGPSPGGTGARHHRQGPDRISVLHTRECPSRHRTVPLFYTHVSVCQGTDRISVLHTRECPSSTVARFTVLGEKDAKIIDLTICVSMKLGSKLYKSGKFDFINIFSST